jgi:glutamate-1-semialdehyde aminotransferase
MGNGYPLGAVITTEEIANSFSKVEYFNTFGGSTVSCVVGLTVLRIIKEEELQKNAKIVGDHLLNALKSLQERHLSIGDGTFILSFSHSLFLVLFGPFISHILSRSSRLGSLYWSRVRLR